MQEAKRPPSRPSPLTPLPRERGTGNLASSLASDSQLPPDDRVEPVGSLFVGFQQPGEQSLAVGHFERDRLGRRRLARPVAAGVLYPFFGILLSPIIAAAAMSLSSVSVVGNALRLRNVDLD